MCVIYILHIICMYSLCDMYIDDIIHACMSCVILLIDTHTAILSYYICIHIHICIYTYYIYTYYIYIYIIYTHTLHFVSLRTGLQGMMCKVIMQFSVHFTRARAERTAVASTLRRFFRLGVGERLIQYLSAQCQIADNNRTGCGAGPCGPTQAHI